MTDFVIVQSGYQVEPQSKATAAVAIPLGNDAKDFQVTNHVLNQNPLPRQLTVGVAFFFTPGYDWMRWKSGTACGISKTKIVREINGAAQNIKTGEQAIFFLSEVQAEMSCHNS